MAEAVCCLCDEVCENPKAECPETFCCEECRAEIKATLWEPSWSQAAKPAAAKPVA